MFLKCREDEGFSGGSVVKDLPANAGDTGAIPGLGRCRGSQLLSPGATAAESVCHTSWSLNTPEPPLPNKSSHHQKEKRAPRN